MLFNVLQEKYQLRKCNFLITKKDDSFRNRPFYQPVARQWMVRSPGLEPNFEMFCDELKYFYTDLYSQLMYCCSSSKHLNSSQCNGKCVTNRVISIDNPFQICYPFFVRKRFHPIPASVCSFQPIGRPFRQRAPYRLFNLYHYLFPSAYPRYNSLHILLLLHSVFVPET